MAKMHELLAVETDIQGQFRTILEETVKVFKNEHLFKGFSKKLEMFDENESHLNETEHKEIGTTVPQRLDYTSKFICRLLDVRLQKEATNQEASSDLVVDGVTIAKDVPATALLGLESTLKDIRKIYEGIPTLEVGTRWEKAEDIGPGVFRQFYPEKSKKTRKEFRFQILDPATDKHPAQIEKWEEQLPVGEYTKENLCSMLTSTRKVELLDRISRLSKSVKKARQRANNTEVKKVKIGSEIMKFIHAE
jgi:hypothetical protein